MIEEVNSAAPPRDAVFASMAIVAQPPDAAGNLSVAVNAPFGNLPLCLLLLGKAFEVVAGKLAEQQRRHEQAAPIEMAGADLLARLPAPNGAPRR